MSKAIRATILAAAVTIGAAAPQAARAVCGDGVLEPVVEECDDGNVAGGDGCNSTCQIRLCLDPPPPAEACVQADDALLKIRQSGKPDKIRAKFDLSVWGFDQDLALSDFGDPVFSTTRFDVCIYDAVALNGQLIVSRGFRTCGKKKQSCWRTVRDDTYRFRDADAVAMGIHAMDVTAGPAGAGLIKVSGKRTKKIQNLPLLNATLADDDVIHIRVMTDGGLCVAASLYDVVATEFSLKARTGSPPE